VNILASKIRFFLRYRKYLKGQPRDKKFALVVSTIANTISVKDLVIKVYPYFYYGFLLHLIVVCFLILNRQLSLIHIFETNWYSWVENMINKSMLLIIYQFCVKLITETAWKKHFLMGLEIDWFWGRILVSYLSKFVQERGEHTQTEIWVFLVLTLVSRVIDFPVEALALYEVKKKRTFKNHRKDPLWQPIPFRLVFRVDLVRLI
jgi:hypothetical protein